MIQKTISICMACMLLLACTNEQPKQHEQVERIIDTEITPQTNTPLATLNNAIIANPNNYKVYLNRANYYINERNFDKAREDANRALRIDPNKAEVAYVKGVVLLKTNQIKEALTFFEHAVELDSNYAPAYLELAYINMAIPDFDKSIEQINKALRINKYLPKGYFYKGMWYERQGRDALASSSYQTAIERNPNYYEAYLMQGALHDRLDNPLAIQYFNTAISLKPKSIEAWRMKAISYKDHNQFNEAIACFDTIIGIDSTFEVAYFDKGTTLLNLCLDDNPKAKNDSLLQEALVQFNKAIQLNNNYVPARYNRGLCYEDLGLKDKARLEYKQVLEIEPNYDLAVKGMNRL